MPNYRRARIKGATYFFTLALQDRASSLLVDQIDDLRSAYASALREMPVYTEAIVVLPDHLHAVWTLPEGDSNFPDRWRRFKYAFTRKVGRSAHPTQRSNSKIAKREAGIWQRRYWEHVIRNEADYRAHVAYCWSNPVRHGLVARAIDWPHSSIHRDVRLGRVDTAWNGSDIAGDYGEPVTSPRLNRASPPPTLHIPAPLPRAARG